MLRLFVFTGNHGMPRSLMRGISLHLLDLIIRTGSIHLFTFVTYSLATLSNLTLTVTFRVLDGNCKCSPKHVVESVTT